MYNLLIALAASALIATSCGAPDARDDVVAPPATSADSPAVATAAVEDVCDVDSNVLVPAREVEIVGSLVERERRLVGWALDRFEQASLQLPSVILVTFDPTKEVCGGAMGLCRPTRDPPEVHTCVEDVDEVPGAEWSREKLVTLHELAHVWHWRVADDLDAQAIVGGIASGGADVFWSKRTEERVAVVVSWGLLDTLQRPRMTAIDCVDMYAQFIELTGAEPLEPLDPSCRPGENQPPSS